MYFYSQKILDDQLSEKLLSIFYKIFVDKKGKDYSINIPFLKGQQK